MALSPASWIPTGGGCPKRLVCATCRYGLVLDTYRRMGMNSKVGMHLCGIRFCVDGGDNDDNDRDYYHNRNKHAPVTKTLYAPMRFSETH